MLRSLGHRAPLLWIVLPYAAGLIAAKLTGWQFVLGPLALGFLTGLLALFTAGKPFACWAAPMIATGLLAGFASYGMHRARLPSWESLPAREARVSLRIDRVYSQVDPKRTTGLATLTAAEDHLHDLVGQRIYFALTLRKDEHPPLRSAIVSAVGVLVTLPANPPGESFDSHLAGAGINFRLTRGRVIATTKPANAYHAFCARAGARFHVILGEGILARRPALAGLLRAMMLGSTHDLSNEQQALFMESGTMHLFAISGLNIGVIAGSLQTLLLLFRLPPSVRFLIGTAALWLFVDITGASPSAVRAFIMAAFLQAAFVFRRPSNVLASLVFSAFVVLLVSPLQLFSASFLMSYTIVAALLVLGLPLSETWAAAWTPWQLLPKPAWRWWHHGIGHAWRALAAALAVGVATTLVSVLTGIRFFGLLTPGALVANLLLIPAAMIATLGGFASLLCGLVGLSAGAALCNHAAALVLWFIEGLVRLSVRLPGSSLAAKFDAEWIGHLAFAALLASLLWGYALRWRRSAGGWWPPFIIVAVTLLCGVTFS